MMWISSSDMLLLKSPQRLKARGLTLISILLGLAGGEGGAMICLVMEACMGGLNWLLGQGLHYSNNLNHAWNAGPVL